MDSKSDIYIDIIHGVYKNGINTYKTKVMQRRT